MHGQREGGEREQPPQRLRGHAVRDPRAGAQALVNLLGKLVGLGLTWSMFQHMATGIRHFVLDTGAGYELKTNRLGSILTIVFSVVATLVFWAVIVGKY